MAELATPMMDVIVDDEDGGGPFSARHTSSSTAADSVASHTSSIGRRAARWQCLEDVDMEGIDLCSVSGHTSHEEDGTQYMRGFST